MKKIVIIGGGIIGLSIAEHLVGKGIKPIIIERQNFASEASWASSGFLDLRVASERGKSFFDLCKLSCDLYPEWIERLRRVSGVDPEYVSSGSFDLVYDSEENDVVLKLEKDLAQYDVHGEWLSGDEVRKLEPSVSPELQKAFYLEHPCQVRTPRLNRALLGTLNEKGVELIEYAEVLDFEQAGGDITTIRTSKGVFPCDAVIIAAGPWTGLITEKLGLSIPTHPVRGQALMLRDFPRKIRHILFGLNWYIVPRLDGRIFVGSTVEKVGFVKQTTPFGMQKLSRLAIKTIPDFAGATIEGSWSGLRPGTHDGLPYLGQASVADNLWIASGHFTHGVVLAAVTGRLIAQSVMGEKTDLDLASFSPNRYDANFSTVQEVSYSLSSLD